MGQLLVVEDQLVFVELLRVRLQKYEISAAATLRDANLLLCGPRQFVGIILDGFIKSHQHRTDTLGFTRRLVMEGFRKPLFAFSGDESMRRKQLAAGCTHELPKTNDAQWVPIIDEALQGSVRRP